MHLLNLPFAVSLETSDIDTALTLTTIKTFLKIDHTDDDQLLLDLRQGAVDSCEKYLGQSILVKTYVAKYSCEHPYFKLLYGPVATILTVKLQTAKQQLQLTSQDYYTYDNQSLLRIIELPIQPQTLTIHYQSCAALSRKVAVEISNPDPEAEISNPPIQATVATLEDNPAAEANLQNNISNAIDSENISATTADGLMVNVLPADLTQGLLMHIANMYEQRSGDLALPPASLNLYSPYRRFYI